MKDQSHIDPHVSDLDRLHGHFTGRTTSSGDVARESVSGLFGVLILVVWLYGTAGARERRSGYVIHALRVDRWVGRLIIHMRGAGLVGGRIANYSGVFFWSGRMIALGVTSGPFSITLSRAAVGPATGPVSIVRWQPNIPSRLLVLRRGMLCSITLPPAGSPLFWAAVALLVKKGGTIHRRSGLLFVCSMIVLGTRPRYWGFAKSPPTRMCSAA